MADAAPKARPRPISPNIQLDGGIWRWHFTMFASILHRASGLGLYVGALILMWWALALASGPDAYGTFVTVTGSIFGKVVLIGLSACAFYHLGNGLRHLAWDSGIGFEIKTADRTAWWAIGFGIVATAVFWTLIFWAGAE